MSNIPNENTDDKSLPQESTITITLKTEGNINVEISEGVTIETIISSLEIAKQLVLKKLDL